MAEAGKGDKRRPMNITEDQLSFNWDLIFNKWNCEICNNTYYEKLPSTCEVENCPGKTNDNCIN